MRQKTRDRQDGGGEVTKSAIHIGMFSLVVGLRKLICHVSNLLIALFFSTGFLLRFGDKQSFTWLVLNDLQNLSPSRHLRQIFDSLFSGWGGLRVGFYLFRFFIGICFHVTFL
jgi:hypothetical protein